MISKSADRERSCLGYLVLTGATGFVGRYLMRDLLLDGQRLAVIVRPGRNASAQARIDEILIECEREMGRVLPRPVVLEGNISEPNCGLSQESLNWIAVHCTRMLHNAAVLRFHASNHADEPWRTNLDGTRNILELCRAAGIREFHSVSTAYVCGDRPGTILESDLDVGQDFRNDYERSKFESEKLIRRADHFDSVTIYRPAVIAGDSSTGYTCSYHGLYHYLRLMALLVPMVEPDQDGVRHTDMRLPMSGDEPRNIVPVDWVSEVICDLIGKPEAHGNTFHLAPDHPITPRQVVEYGYDYFNSTGVIYLDDEGSPSGESFTGTSFEARFLESVKQYERYNHTDPCFDRTNLQKFASHLPCPEIDRRVISLYFRFGEKHRWGKLKRKPLDLLTDVHDHLESMRQRSLRVFSIDDLSLSNANDSATNEAHPVNGTSPESFVLGLDLLGQGGGQWHLIGHPHVGFEIRLGLPSESAPVLHLTAEEFRQLAADKQEPSRRHYLNIQESTDTEQYDRIVGGVVGSLVSAAAC